MEFPRIKRLPPYVFNVVGDLKLAARRAGEDIIDLSMGNPDGADSAAHRAEPGRVCPEAAEPPLLRVARHLQAARRHLRLVPAPLRRRVRPRRRGDRHHRLEGGHRSPGARHAGPGRRGLLPEPDLSHPSVLGDHRGRRPALHSAHAGRRLPRPAAGGRAHHLAEAEAAHPELPRQPHHRGGRSGVLRKDRRVCARARVPRGARSGVRRPVLRRLPGAVPDAGARARATSASSSSRCRRATTCRAGASGSRSATATSSPPSRASRATSTTAPSSRSRSRPSTR